MGFWSGLGNMVSKGAGAVADGLGTVVDLGADALAHIPVVGDTLSQGVGAIGDAGVEALQGNFSTALGDLYGGVDVLVGGVLPGGQAAAQGYLSNPLSSLYNKADMAVGGYLPNIGGGVPGGGIGYSPTYVSAQKAFDALPGPGGSTYAGGGGMSTVALPGGEAGKAAPGFWDKASAAANLAQTGAMIYGLMQDSPEATNAQAYQRATGTGPQRVAIQPGLGGGGSALNPLGVPTNNVVASDPAMGGTPEAKSSTGKGGEAPKTPELTKVSDQELESIQNKAIGQNHTQATIGNVTGQRGPTAPAMTASSGVVGASPQLNMFTPTPLGMARSPYTSNIPGGPRAEYARPVSNIPGGPRREYLSR